MRAASLLGVFLTARVLLLFDREIPVSAWTLPAYLWQDLLVVLLFAVVDLLLRRAWPAWILYGLVALYAAINLPLARVTSSPLTWPMLRAARETLADSIAHHLTPGNLFLILLGAATVSAASLSLLLRPSGRRLGRSATA